ncbi:unnamed protein product [Coffea canephora]|uniref:RBR-type E3 ubiquitin transferase n=1 Tax=Coffea canephora TaxID=49390 RepID=A0A068UKC5_COFCA|nr:unnamed protein product [Coffea canephora]
MENAEVLNNVDYAYVEGSSSSSSSSSSVDENEIYSVYFKGLVREEKANDSEMGGVGIGIGVVICDSMKHMIFESSKAMKSRGDTCRLEARLEALIEGLTGAKQLGIRRLRFFCKSRKLYNYLIDDENAEEGLNMETAEELRMIPTIGRVKSLRAQFEECSPSLVRKDDAEFGRRADNLARKAKFAQVSCPEVISKETCEICMEDTDVVNMLSVHNCTHRCCSSCAKKHIEVKLREGTLPKCPQDGCHSDIKIDKCINVLSPELVEVLNQRVKEAKIPVLDRIYCPHPRCSNLMSKTEVLNYSKSRNNNTENGYGICFKCHGPFCINCKVPWHNEMTCSDYKELHPYSCIEDEMLSSLAKRNSWQQCIKCSHMIELDVGCYHIICRCGHQFCYTCGSEWKENKATCNCPLWDEDRIIY